MPGSVSHAKKHGIASTKDHKPVVGAVENHVAVFDANGLPVRDSTIAISSLVGGLIPQGGWNADTNTPTIVSGVGTPGYFWYVTVPGTTNVDGIYDWEIGDLIFYDGVSSTYKKIDNTDRVWEVDGRTGSVALNMSYITKAHTIGNTPPPSPSESMKGLLSQGSGGLWAGHDWEVASFDKGVWTFRTPTVGEVFLVLTCPPYNSPPLDYQVPNLFVFKNSRWEEFVPASLREAPFVTGTTGLNIKNFSGQAVGLYVNTNRGNDTYGDGSLFNPFKTVQACVNYAYTNYPTEYIEIYISTFDGTVAENVTTEPGQFVTFIANSDSYGMLSLTISVQQFSTVITKNIATNIVELDADTKYVEVVEGTIGSWTPFATPGIGLELVGTYVNTSTMIIIKAGVASVYGWYKSVDISGNVVVCHMGTADEDDHLIRKKQLEDDYEGKVRIGTPDLFPDYLDNKLVVSPTGLYGITKELLYVGSDYTMFIKSYQEHIQQANYTNGGQSFTYPAGGVFQPAIVPNIQVSVQDLGVVANLYGFQTRFVHTIDGYGNYIGCVVHVSKMYRVGANVFIAECATNDCRVHIRASAEAL